MLPLPVNLFVSDKKVPFVQSAPMKCTGYVGGQTIAHDAAVWWAQK